MFMLDCARESGASEAEMEEMRGPGSEKEMAKYREQFDDIWNDGKVRWIKVWDEMENQRALGVE